jgi:hypothetical protein
MTKPHLSFDPSLVERAYAAYDRYEEERAKGLGETPELQAARSAGLAALDEWKRETGLLNQMIRSFDIPTD